MPTQCGIFSSDPNGSFFPLVSARCHYTVIDVQTVASLVQTYICNAVEAQSVVYVFPLPSDAAVCAFKAIIDDKRVVKGVVQEKGQAKRNYEQAVKEGKTAGLLEKQHADVFQISLGNIQPNQRIEVHITFMSIIKHDGSLPNALRLMIPVAIAPRYGQPPTFDGPIPTASKADITISVAMTGIITSVTSPTHPVDLTLGVDRLANVVQGVHEANKAHVSIISGEYLDKDIVVVIASQQLDRPRCVMEASAEHQTSAFALSFVPQFNLPPLPCQSYIFLVDRSGSMEGPRIKAVRAALQIMLRSLPTKNSFFNIWSFGDRHKSLWLSNKVYSSDSVAEATAYVDKLQADYGGTEIAKALRAVYANVKAGYSPSEAAEASSPFEVVPTSVFVLTDGEAWDLEGVLEAVRIASEDAKQVGTLLRTFVLGVGDNVSTPMCDGIARSGRGISVFVADNEKPEKKLMGLLRSARGGVIEELSIDWGVPDPRLPDTPTDDFEMIDAPSAAVPPLPCLPSPGAPDSTPLQLFDPSSADNADTSNRVALGPEKIIVKLGAPPFMQQSPATPDKLPIPLYPGFRCSIFALLQTHLAAPPTSVKLTGRVLGRDIILAVPVTAYSSRVSPGEGADKMHLPIHTLAARALIQQLEDTPSSPQRDAEIVRLALQYPLVSSQTSFVAIADAVGEEEEMFIAEDESPKPKIGTLGGSGRGLGGKGLGMGGAKRHRKILRDPGTDEEKDEDEEDEDEDEEDEVQEEKDEQEADQEEESIAADDDDDVLGPSTGASGTKRFHPGGKKAGIKRRRIWTPPTVEDLARAQSFDGSFPLSTITESPEIFSSTSPLPLSLIFSKSTSGNATEEQSSIWSTVLVVIYLQAKFNDDKEAWDVMAEKAIEYVRVLLSERGVAEGEIDGLIDGLFEEARKALEASRV